MTAHPPVPAELLLAASVLGELALEVAFVGGAAVPVWITEPAAPPPRATDDVDAVCDVATYGEYQALANRLREKGLVEDAGSSVICRWKHAKTNLVLDVMPKSDQALGFSNEWYPLVLDTAVELPTASATLRVARPDLMVATKLAAWRSRGNGDVLGSIDVADVVILVNGRPELEGELRNAPAELQVFVRDELDTLVADSYFDYLIQDVAGDYGGVADERADVIRDRLSAIRDALSSVG